MTEALKIMAEARSLRLWACPPVDRLCAGFPRQPDLQLLYTGSKRLYSALERMHSEGAGGEGEKPSERARQGVTGGAGGAGGYRCWARMDDASRHREKPMLALRACTRGGETLLDVCQRTSPL